jgi:hypothetical protein
VPNLNYYRRGDNEVAFIEAKHFNTPIFWDPLIQAMVLVQLDHQAELNGAVVQLFALVPDFKSRGNSLIKRMVYLDEHVDMLLDGLRKAGLELDATE